MEGSISRTADHPPKERVCPPALFAGTFLACLLRRWTRLSQRLAGRNRGPRQIGLPDKRSMRLLGVWIFIEIPGALEAEKKGEKMLRKVRRIFLTLLVGVLVGGSSTTASAEKVKAPFDPEGKPLLYVSFLPLVTDKGDFVPVLVEFYRTPAGEVVVEWNPFETRRLQAVDLSPADPCGPIWINKALLTRERQSGWRGWILRSEPIERDEWGLEPSISPKCRKQLASIE